MFSSAPLNRKITLCFNLTDDVEIIFIISSITEQLTALSPAPVHYKNTNFKNIHNLIK